MNQYITRVHEVELRDHLYLGFAYDRKDPDAELPKIAFANRFGYEPQKVIIRPGGVLVGPTLEGQGY